MNIDEAKVKFIRGCSLVQAFMGAGLGEKPNKDFCRCVALNFNVEEVCFDADCKYLCDPLVDDIVYNIINSAKVKLTCGETH